MNLKEALLKEHSKENTLYISKYIGKNEKRFHELMMIFFQEEYRLVQRAAWVVDYCTEQHDVLIRPYLNEMVNYLEKPVHDAVKRNTLRIFQRIEIPEEIQGKLVNICFSYLENPKEAIAIKAFSMTVIARICEYYPELAIELKTVIEDMLKQDQKPAIISRANKTLKQIHKMI